MRNAQGVNSQSPHTSGHPLYPSLLFLCEPDRLSLALVTTTKPPTFDQFVSNWHPHQQANLISSRLLLSVDFVDTVVAFLCYSHHKHPPASSPNCFLFVITLPPLIWEGTTHPHPHTARQASPFKRTLFEMKIKSPFVIKERHEEPKRGIKYRKGEQRKNKEKA